VAAALAGCGGGEERAASTPTPARTASPAPTATPTAFAPSAPKPPVLRLRLTLRDDGFSPRRVTAPSFVPVRLVVRNASGRERLVSVAGTTKALALGPGVQATLDVDALEPGRHAIRSEPGGRATLVVRTHEP
jgi:hypothetical protein